MPQGTRTQPAVPPPVRSHTWTPAQREMAADLLAIANQHGRALDDGRVLVPLPLAEVSARSGRGRNCGTLYAHARALRPAIEKSTGSSGIVFDPARCPSSPAAAPA